MKKREATLIKTSALVSSMGKELEELEILFNFQYDSPGNLKEKLAASRRARMVLKKCRQHQKVIAGLLDKLS